MKIKLKTTMTYLLISNKTRTSFISNFLLIKAKYRAKHPKSHTRFGLNF